jgi:wyosine [tRNA(Phe)-imidazoG37] synthetase (radical SAM superfamily)
MLCFGPVPSRRLGRSLGINHIGAKSCTFGCVYCQIGASPRKSVDPADFADPAAIEREVSERVRTLRERGERIDHLSFVPDGEPTLDRRLGESIGRIRPLGIPGAVVTNGSLLSRPEVREALAKADRVSLKVDTVDETLWRRHNRPHPSLRLDEVLKGMRTFAAGFRGELDTETMLIAGVNEGEAAVLATAAFVVSLKPRAAYLAVPTRPPTEPWCRPPDGASLNRAKAIFAAAGLRVELLTAATGTDFGATGDFERDLLAIAAVHPVSQATVWELARKCGADPAGVDDLVARGMLRKTVFDGQTYFRT